MRTIIFLIILTLITCFNFISCSGGDDKNDGQEELSSDKQLLSFVINSSEAEIVINENSKTVSLVLPAGSMVQTPTITVSEGATVSPASGVEQDFSDNVIYTVTAEDGSEVEYTIQAQGVSTPLASIITSFVFSAELNNDLTEDIIGIINQEEKIISFGEQLQGIDVTSLIPTLIISQNATVSPDSGVAQDFSDTVTYTVTGGDDSTSEYNVYLESINLPIITGFAFNAASNDALNEDVIGEINETTQTIEIVVPEGTDVTALTAEVITENAISYTPDGAQDYTQPVTITVSSENDEFTSDYEVIVTIEDDPFLQNGIRVKELASLPEAGRVSVDVDYVSTRFTSFTLNGKGYVVNRHGKVFEYDPENNTWTEKADFPGEDRVSSYGFTMGNYGYIGFGYIDGAIHAEDIWAYNATNDSWKELTNVTEMPILGIYKPYATVMAFSDKLYIANGAFNDFFAGTISGNTSVNWASTKITSYPSDERSTPMYFSINGKYYWGGARPAGVNVHSRKFYSYTQGSNNWETLNDLPDDLIRDRLDYTFTIGNYAYSLDADVVWKYYSASDTWEKIDFDILTPYYNVTFTIGDTAYVMYEEGAKFYSFKEE